MADNTLDLNNDVRRMFTLKTFSNCENKRFIKEGLTFNVTEDILVEMEKQNISKDDLARKISRSKGFVKQTLNGKRNLTLNTLSDICHALNLKLSIKVEGS